MIRFRPVLILITGLFATTAASARSGEPWASGWLFEMAPLQGALGQVAVRAEKVISYQWAVGGAYEKISEASEHSDMKDSRQRFGGEAVYYPKVEPVPGLFLALGGQIENALVGHQKLRPYLTNVRYTAEDDYDSWVNADQMLSLAGAVGYRLPLGPWITSSLRWNFVKPLAVKSTVHSEDIKSYDVKPELAAAKADSQALVFQIGIAFP